MQETILDFTDYPVASVNPIEAPPFIPNIEKCHVCITLLLTFRDQLQNIPTFLSLYIYIHAMAFSVVTLENIIQILS